MSNRKCIFTGEESDYKLNIAREDHHNWAKSVPTTKAYVEAYLKNRNLNELEMRQVELFFQMELCKIKQLTIMDRMTANRSRILEGMDSFDTVDRLKFYKPDIVFNEEMQKDMQEKVVMQALSSEPLIIDEPEDLDAETVKKILDEPPLIPKKAEVVQLSTPKKDDKIKKKVVKKKPALWD